VRAENRSLKQEIEQMRLQQVRMSQDADQAHRLQALLAFKEQFISQTMAAQVIGGSGSEQSRSVFIDKGYADGIRPDMAVITADGVVGKIWHADPLNRHVAQVLLIDDQSSGVGGILDKSRLQGIVRGTPSGEVVLEKVMSDETVPAGEVVLTSGGDGIFPKGLLVGHVTKVAPGSELFLNIRLRPAANLNKLEEVLVVTKIDQRQAQPDQAGPARAVDILAERLPTVPPKPESTEKPAEKTAGGETAAPKTGTNLAKPPGAAASATPDSAKPNVAPKLTPKVAPPQASTNGSAATTNPTKTPAASRPLTTTPPAAGQATATTPAPKPVKAATTPKPQTAVEDTPH
jgi:rod shape-determining protein MreC